MGSQDRWTGRKHARPAPKEQLVTAGRRPWPVHIHPTRASLGLWASGGWGRDTEVGPLLRPSRLWDLNSPARAIETSRRCGVPQLKILTKQHADQWHPLPPSEHHGAMNRNQLSGHWAGNLGGSHPSISRVQTWLTRK